MAKVKIMGILNVTPDSFSDGGDFFGNIDRAVSRVAKMLEEGADIVDIGGESTRPGSEFVSAEEELSRVLPVIEEIRKKLGDKIVISIDTNKANVARHALEKGANIINSIGGWKFDPEIAKVASEFECPVVIYHIKGLPKTMQAGEITYSDVVGEIKEFFEEQIKIGAQFGIKRDKYIIDPGIGFGKTVEQNLEIIKRLSEFKVLNLPILIGISRKSHLGELLKEKLSLDEVPSPTERLEASLAETAIAVQNGASIVRTHDVAQTKRFLTVLEELI